MLIFFINKEELKVREEKIADFHNLTEEKIISKEAEIDEVKDVNF